MSVLDSFLNMPEDTFDTLSVSILVTGLIIYMGFVIYRMAKDSNAGKFGTVILFFVLGFGMLGFIIKTILTEVLQK
ncbi:DUF2788 domain-containing protein [Silvimonas iriomotensis]|uniref:DUF2788 domain-containing protein n=1 Tax=Silvimonas iriomotensis TaxID=449662 RepID=A0ABQ2P5D7_9NEIS|nr:DUF2788 domain-containing protein [Silvimonas iriomotensis]GGP18284.1 hypothetical protein GCM10010970_04150 [Silvimonas iriomotensis]